MKVHIKLNHKKPKGFITFYPSQLSTAKSSKKSKQISSMDGCRIPKQPVPAPFMDYVDLNHKTETFQIDKTPTQTVSFGC